MSIKLVMPSKHLLLCHPLLLLPSVFPSIRGFSNESVLRIRWPSIGVSSSASVLPMNIQRQEYRDSAGDYQVDEQAGVARLRLRVSGRWAGRSRAAHVNVGLSENQKQKVCHLQQSSTSSVKNFSIWPHCKVQELTGTWPIKGKKWALRNHVVHPLGFRLNCLNDLREWFPLHFEKLPVIQSD